MGDRLPELTDTDVDAAWERVERWLGEHAPAGAATLRAGATAGDFDACEAAIGTALPSDLRRSLSRHDGQETDDEGLALGLALAEDHWLLSADELAGDWRGLLEVSEDLGASDDWWRKEWIPFSADGTGTHFCVDTRTGEVIEFDHEGEGTVVARSLAGWLARWADELEAGVQRVDPDTGDVVLS
jgi:cell wall assembly regulator SMI1